MGRRIRWPRAQPRPLVYRIGGRASVRDPGWGNNELQWYAAENVSLRDGHLVIEARARRAMARRTHLAINTRDRVAFRYGRIEARIKLPDGQGMWPAFWLLPQNDRYGTWAGSGEIDILEAVNLGGDGRNDIHGTIHFGGPWPDNLQAGQAHIVSTFCRGSIPHLRARVGSGGAAVVCGRSTICKADSMAHPGSALSSALRPALLYSVESCGGW